jgi:hypothetical protein
MDTMGHLNFRLIGPKRLNFIKHAASYTSVAYEEVEGRRFVQHSRRKFVTDDYSDSESNLPTFVGRINGSSTGPGTLV